MDDKELEIEFDKYLVERNLAFSSNLNPFDMFKIGIEFANKQSKPVTFEQHLLTIIMEECAEIQQAASKAIRFGLNSYHKEGDPDNRTQLLQEFNDLVAVIELLCLNNNIEDLIDVDRIKAKKDKVKHFMHISKNLGRL